MGEGGRERKREKGKETYTSDVIAKGTLSAAGVSARCGEDGFGVSGWESVTKLFEGVNHEFHWQFHSSLQEKGGKSYPTPMVIAIHDPTITIRTHVRRTFAQCAEGGPTLARLVSLTGQIHFWSRRAGEAAGAVREIVACGEGAVFAGRTFFGVDESEKDEGAEEEEEGGRVV